MRSLVIGVLAIAAVPALGQDQLADIPENHWAYELAANLQAEGALRYPFQGMGLIHGWRPPTRYEALLDFYWSTNDLAAVLDRRIHDYLRGRDLNPRVPSPNLLEGLHSYQREFATEAKRIGLAKGAVLGPIDRCRLKIELLAQLRAGKSPRFTDVPANHWAAGAVGELQRAGILVGYPGGKF